MAAARRRANGERLLNGRVVYDTSAPMAQQEAEEGGGGDGEGDRKKMMTLQLLARACLTIGAVAGRRNARKAMLEVALFLELQCGGHHATTRL